MRSSVAQFSLFVSGLALVVAALMSIAAPQSLAAPVQNIKTPATEPPPPTDTPAVPDPGNTPVVPDPSNTPAVPDPGNTPVVPDPGNTPVVPDPGNTPVAPPPDESDPEISKSVEPAAAFPGDTVTYSIRVGNDGSATARDVLVEDNLPAELEILSAIVDHGTVQVSGNSLIWTVGDVRPDQDVFLTITTRISPAADPGALTNIATLTSSDSPPKTSTTTVTIVRSDPTSTPTASPIISPTLPPAVTFTATVPPQPTPAPQPTPVPERLPVTGDNGAAGVGPFLLILGIGLMLASLFIRVRRS
jgi:uncharacterized repeat protein (TIGR01451 family)